MRKLAIFLLVVSPLWTAVGMAGCAASIGSIGNTSREMTWVEAFGLLVAPLLFVAGVVLFVADWRRRRRRSVAEAGPSSLASVTISIGRIVTRSALVAVAFGILGLALNFFFLMVTADAWLTAVESGSIAKYAVIPMACLLGCLPVGYAVLAWRGGLKKRIGAILRPHEDAIMQAMESAVIDYMKNRSQDAPRATVLAACVRRVANLPDPVKRILARVAQRTDLAHVLDLATGPQCPSEVPGQILVSAAITGMRSKLDEVLFSPQRHRLLYLFLLNLLLFGLMLGVTGSLAKFTGSLIAGALLAAAIALSNHPVAKNIRGALTDFLKPVLTAISLIGLTATGVLLIRRKRPQPVRWVGYILMEIIYALLILFAGLVLDDAFHGELSHIIAPLAVLVFIVPSLLLLRWIRATRDTPRGTAIVSQVTPSPG